MVVKIARKSVRKKGNNMRSGRRLRGSGNRGGSGRGGSGKRGRQKKTKFILEPRKKGFFSIYTKMKTVNIGYLNNHADELVKSGAAKKENDAIVIDVSALGFDKVLGKGKVDKKLVVKAKSFSKNVADKVVKSGGETVVLGLK